MSFTRTTSDSFASALADAIEEPAVGTPLHLDDVSLEDTDVALDPSTRDLEEAKTGVTPATFAIADYGSIIIQPTEQGEGPVSLYTELHVGVLAKSDIVEDMPAGFERLREEFEDGITDAIIATGPSATADMGALVQGAHGPKETHVIILEDK